MSHARVRGTKEARLDHIAALRGKPGYLAARNAFVTAELPLARHFAKRWRRGGRREDLVQVAAVALVEAVDRWQVGRRSWPMWAWWRARYQLSRWCSSREPVVTIPGHVAVDKRRVLRARAALGADASPEDLAAWLGIVGLGVLATLLATAAWQFGSSRVGSASAAWCSC